MSPLPPELIRNHVSHGSRALVALAFGDGRNDYEALCQEFLAIYSEHLSRKTRLFDGFDAVLAQVADSRLPWGIVTNKPELYTRMILDDLKLSPAPGTVVRSEEHTSELQSRGQLVCRLLLEKKKKTM